MPTTTSTPRLSALIWDRVIVLWPDPLEEGPAAEHQRRLLYTAITRARASLDLVTLI